MNTLTIFYDADCGLCSTVRRWLASQPAYLRLEFLPYDSAEAQRRLPALRHLHPDQEIVVMLDTGEVWQGASAWVVCLWALYDYRRWSVRLATPAMAGLARALVQWLSRNRITLSELLRFRSDDDLRAALTAAGANDASRCLSRHDFDLID